MKTEKIISTMSAWCYSEKDPLTIAEEYLYSWDIVDLAIAWKHCNNYMVGHKFWGFYNGLQDHIANAMAHKIGK